MGLGLDVKFLIVLFVRFDVMNLCQLLLVTRDVIHESHSVPCCTSISG